MRLIIQRVKSAKVTDVGSGKITGKIRSGLFVLVGFKKGDTKEKAANMVQKLLILRIMPDQNSKMNLTVADAGGKFLIVSQFTLYANTKDGNRPSFIEAEEPQKAEELYNYFIESLENSGAEVETGKFGAYMSIDVLLDGPVTILSEN